MSSTSSGSLARRYARALIDLAKEAGPVDAFAAHLKGLMTAFQTDAGLLLALSDDSHPESQRTAAVSEIADKIGAHPLLKNFLLLLTQKLRIALLPEIVQEYEVFCDELLGIVRVIVKTPKTPDQTLLSRVEQLLGQQLKKRVICTGVAHPEMIGGIILQVNYTIYDGSIVRDLERIKEKLLAA
jgi:F-type H+-transporting ATPase subunit delta